MLNHRLIIQPNYMALEYLHIELGSKSHSITTKEYAYERLLSIESKVSLLKENAVRASYQSVNFGILNALISLNKLKCEH